MGLKSAGILLYRIIKEPQVLLVHPGGPYHVNKDLGAWSIPKGLFEDDEDPLDAAKREFQEELGLAVRATEFIPLKPIKQKGGKVVYAWAAMGNLDVSTAYSNTFRMQWPPRSGKWIDVPEVDRAEWFSLRAAREKILSAQVPLLDELEAKLTGG